MYGRQTETPPLDWDWVDRELAAAGAYWAVTVGAGPAHARPLWGLWLDELVHLSVGSPRLTLGMAADEPVTVHLGGANDVVIIEGRSAGPTEDGALIAAYNRKYDWDYEVTTYGPLTTVVPDKILAWRSAGWAGRDGFQQTGRWRFDR